jgi:hypothetical protein
MTAAHGLFQNTMPAPTWKEQGQSEKPWKVNFCINAQYMQKLCILKNEA